MDQLQHYMNSGIIEQYVLGLLNENEKQEFEALLPRYPQLREEVLLAQISFPPESVDWEMPPPASVKERLFHDETNALTKYSGAPYKKRTFTERLIHITMVSSKYMDVDKWVIVLAAIFLLVMISSAVFLVWYSFQ